MTNGSIARRVVRRAYEEMRLKLREREIEGIKPTFYDVSHIFKKSKCRMIKRELRKGGVVLAVILPKFKGLLVKDSWPEAVFAIYLCEELKKVNGRGFISTDELPNYGIRKSELRSLRDELKVGPDDDIALVAAPYDVAKVSLEVLVELINGVIDGNNDL